MGFKVSTLSSRFAPIAELNDSQEYWGVFKKTGSITLLAKEILSREILEDSIRLLSLNSATTYHSLLG